MALSYGVSLISTLLWGCISFLSQNGYNIAHGFSLDDEFSLHAGMPAPQASNQFPSRASLHPNQDSVSPKDEMQATRRQRFVSPWRKPVDHENYKRASFVSLGEGRRKSKPESEHGVPSSPPASQHEREDSGQHPFGLLVKAHTKPKTMQSTSFSTIQDLKRFIESMKRSFLMPGNAMGRHFQTARETIEKEKASNTQNVNIRGQHDKGYRSDFAKEDPVHEDASGNEDWSEATDQGSNYQMPGKSNSFPDPVDSTASLISTSVYDDHYNGPSAAVYPRHHSAATEDVSSNYGGYDGGISGENPDRFTRAPQVRNKAVQSTSYKVPKQIQSGSFFGNDLSFSGYVTASPVNPPNSPSHNFSNYSSKTLTSKKNIQQHPKYAFPSKASLTGDQKLFGLKLSKYVKNQELSRVTPANILTTPMTPSFTSYGHVRYVSAPRGQRYIPDYQPEHNKSAAKSARVYQPIVGKQSNDIKSTAHLPVYTGSVSLNYNNPSQSSSVLEVQTSSPNDAQILAFIRKKPVRFYPTRTTHPSSSLHGSSRHDGYLKDQPKDEKSDLSKQKRVSATQGVTQKTENTPTPISSRLDSTKTGISSLFRVDDAKSNSLTNLAPTSASKRSKLVANGVMSRNFGINNEISDIRGARKSLSSSSTPQRRSISLNGHYASATRPGLQTLKKPTKLWKRRVIRNKKPVYRVYRRPKLLSASILSPPSVNSYAVKSRNRYARSKESISKTRYAPSAG